jgi:hypothetical protein
VTSLLFCSTPLTVATSFFFSCSSYLGPSLLGY